MVKCDGCGVEKDPEVLEVYPFDDGLLDDEPGEPLLYLECEPKNPADLWRKATVCYHCFNKLDPDMWISERCWIGIDPVVPFSQLPEWRV